MFQQIHVPRIVEITGKLSTEQSRADREWKRMQITVRESNLKHTFGSPEGKAEWLRRVQRTRSF